MGKVFIYSLLLIAGLLCSQILPVISGEHYGVLEHIVRILTLTGLSFIMIHVGLEFEVDKNNLKSYGWDYIVAMTTAGFPWIFVTLYFIYFMMPPEYWTTWDTWKETLLAGRFAAPTSAGVLFSMLAAAGLSATWLFQKAKILAIFDDLDTVLLMIPLKVMMVGFVWQLGMIFFITIGLLIVAWIWLHKIKLPVSWTWVLSYGVIITVGSELIYLFSKNIDDTMGIHIEVLLPAFVLGCVIAHHEQSADSNENQAAAAENTSEKRASFIISAAFMALVGLSMPSVFTADTSTDSWEMSEALHYEETRYQFAQPDPDGEIEESSVLAQQPFPGWGTIAFHVLMITIISNFGKMFPVFCYRKEAHWRERLALSIGMWPRGEVGAGILIVSISYGIGGPILTTAMLSLSLNLLLTGVFIIFVKKLLSVSDVV